eukprot:TRINITY_DN3177_c0_g1_i1.p1 TRINITY_DN3177_c0_g1~~TRINITY_DN3177_c0_g1_i1.p1  ORF type:complete len:177 (+),score=37.80 TRINITY_DN3177_c0_g1_i1:461-991(+)
MIDQYLLENEGSLTQAEAQAINRQVFQLLQQSTTDIEVITRTDQEDYFNSKSPYISLTCRLWLFCCEYWSVLVAGAFAALLLVYFYIKRHRDEWVSEEAQHVVAEIEDWLKGNGFAPFNSIQHYFLKEKGEPIHPSVWEATVSLIRKHPSIVIKTKMLEQGQQATVWQWMGAKKNE